MDTQQTFQQFLQTFKKPLSIDQFKQLSKQYTVIDTRPEGESTGLVKGSYWLPGENLHFNWLPFLLKPEDPYIFVCDRHGLDSALERFILRGYFNCMGFNNFDMRHFDGEMEYLVLRNWRDFGDTERKQFLDVRTPLQCSKTGVIKGAMMIQLKKLDRESEDKLKLLREIQKNKLIVVHCREGMRARLATSILYRHGITSVTLIQKITDFESLGLKMVSVQQNQNYWKQKLQKGLDCFETETEEFDNQEKFLECSNVNRMQVEECYEECLKKHHQETSEQCQKQCMLKEKEFEPMQTVKLEHSSNKNQQQASKMRITPSLLSHQQAHFKQVNEQVKEEQSHPRDLKLQKVIFDIEQHRYQRAIDKLNRLVVQHPDDSQFYINRALCHAKMNEKKLAENDLNLALEKDRLNFVAYFNLASLKLQENKEEKQKKLHVLQNLYCSLSCLYLKRGMKSKFDDDLQKAIHYGPNNIEALAIKSLRLLQKDDFRGSLTLLQKIDKLLNHKNQSIVALIQNIEKKLDSKTKSENPQSSKELGPLTSLQEDKLFVQHFGASQFGKRLVGKTFVSSLDKDIDKEIQEKLQEWNEVYLEMMKKESLELKKLEESSVRTGESHLGGNERRTLWLVQ